MIRQVAAELAGLEHDGVPGSVGERMARQLVLLTLVRVLLSAGLDDLRDRQTPGRDRSHSTLTRQIRTRGLRPHCEPCSATRGRANAPIEHPPGEETQ